MLPMLHNPLSSLKILSLRETWVTSLPQSQLTFQSKKVSWKTLILVLIARPMKWLLTLICSRNSAMSSPRATKKWQGLTLPSSYMKSKLTLTQNRFDRNSTRFTPRNWQLLSVFIYPVPLMEWVSNLVPVAKKQGTILVCVDYHDLNKSCPKDNYPTPFIDQIIDNCAGSVIFSFMDGFSGYNQIEILPADQHKAEVEKLLKSGFIYPVPLMEWVSNLVPVAKKQGTIHVCVDYHDLNKSCH
jgi:hypothetical protein